MQTEGKRMSSVYISKAYSPYLFLYSGKCFDYRNPSALCIEDIAHALSNICRFGGQYPVFYSVAEHSLRLVDMVKEELKLFALLHDCAEAVIGDIPRPMKHLVRLGSGGMPIKTYENQIIALTQEVLIGRKANLAEWDIIEEADSQLLKKEMEEWGSKDFAIGQWGRDVVSWEQSFLDKFWSLKVFKEVK
jgi:hypothetical protein